jgi:hypothetical protein
MHPVGGNWLPSGAVPLAWPFPIRHAMAWAWLARTDVWEGWARWDSRGRNEDGERLQVTAHANCGMMRLAKLSHGHPS